MDFFSGQPDDAKAAQEDSSASSPQWDDAFAGMQKLNLFDEDLGNSRIYLVSVSGNAPQIKTVLEEGGVESFILRQSD